VKILWLAFLPALGYQCLAIVAGLLQVLRRKPDRSFQPGVSVLKPVRGIDPDMLAALRSHVVQDYPSFEVLFGVHDERDPALPEIRKLEAEFPASSIRVIVGHESGLNGKVGILKGLARHARHPVWVVNDSDIRVTPGYLSEVVAPLQDSRIGVVTCLYRPRPHALAAVWEALGIATDFMPSTLVAPLVGVREFGLGSTLAFHSKDLETAGGFSGFEDYLADDYQLARRIALLGKRALLSTYVVETSLGDTTWRGVWDHQLRWGRTIRISKGAGYAGLPVTHAGLWLLIALLLQLWWIAAALAVLRFLVALLTGWFVLRSPVALGLFPLSILWDLYAFALWVASYRSNLVRWRHRELRVAANGRIEPVAGQAGSYTSVTD
jgi:ceramide glucosyltransferase